MEEISVVETRKFKNTTCIESKWLEYPSSEAHEMYLKVIQKYKATDESVLICLRDKDSILIKSELLNYKGKNEKLYRISETRRQEKAA